MIESDATPLFSGGASRPAPCPRIVLAHGGVQYSYQPAVALQDAGMLVAFFTTVYSTSRLRRIANALPHGPSDQALQLLQRRVHPQLDPDRLVVVPLPELTERAVRGLAKRLRLQDETMYRRLRWFDRTVARRIRSLAPDVVIGLSGSALSTLRAAGEVGARAVVDQHDIHYSLAAQLLEEERSLEPSWAGTLPVGVPHRPYLDCVEAEFREADAVFVPSTFARRSHLAAGMAEDHVLVVPHGTEVRSPSPRRHVRRPLRVLFAGQLTQRKGLSYLFSAVASLGTAVRLTVVGDAVGSVDPLARWVDIHEFLPYAGRARLRELFDQSDVLVLPSIYDACGLVALDAMAAGLPVIVSSNTMAGSDVVRDGIDGWVVPIRDPSAIATCLLRLIDEPELAHDVGRTGAQRAKEFSWEAYAHRLTYVVQAIA